MLLHKWDFYQEPEEEDKRIFLKLQVEYLKTSIYVTRDPDDINENQSKDN